MKKLLICLSLVVALCFVFASPVSASGGTLPEKISVSNGFIAFNETIGSHQITVCGMNLDYTPNIANPAFGSFKGHIVRPNGKATEESWFEVTSFTGYIILDYDLYGYLYAFPFNLVNDIKVMVHNGTQSNQPILTLHSSEAIPLFIPDILPFGYYQIVQIQGWNLINAK